MFQGAGIPVYAIEVGIDRKLEGALRPTGVGDIAEDVYQPGWNRQEARRSIKTQPIRSRYVTPCDGLE